ncbi:hypothetical protein LWI28_022899 [Acer negundo]|uniref:Uncharacterized protein n=1 Tax=Acer negundo TaxID=4023 RepID=A0AAD5IKP1_ACENE|nr:hypothetical protein LWI28_022899 [Acer negundo]
MPLVRSSFSFEEADAILSIPLGSVHASDSFQWHYEKGILKLLKVATKWGNFSWLRTARLVLLWMVGSVCGDSKSPRKSSVLFDFLLLFFRILKREEVEILCVMLWRVWYWRNQFIHSPSNYRKKDVFGWASSFLCDYQGANQVTKTPKMKSIAAVPILWCVPLEGTYKINTYAAILENNQLVGFRAIVRYSNGLVLGSSV